MIQDCPEGAAVARHTAELIVAYCSTLEIAAEELPNLIAYVGTVLGRLGPGQWTGMAAEPAAIICLAEYRARDTTRRRPGA